MNKLCIYFVITFSLFLQINAKPEKYTGSPQQNQAALKAATLPDMVFSANRTTMGQTGNNELGNFLIPIGQAPQYVPPEIKECSSQKNLLLETQWTKLDSLYINAFLPAGGNLGVKINIPKRRLDLIAPYTLTNEGKSAVLKSPLWIRPLLENTLGKLNNPRQIELANVINNASDPFIDEIAYSIALSSPAFLNSSYCYPQLFLENARLIYAHDSELKYVEVIDYGNSVSDENYYSTVKYYKIDTAGQKVQIEVPKEVYYEYLVHPKTSDEIAAYIDPGRYEHDQNYANHIYNITAPPKGVFWREFLYSFTEEKPDTTGVYYPILKDSVMTCDVVWDETNKQKDVIKEITEWVKSVMKFDSKQERPHQPVRIYKLHLGRCGEHEDLTNAASRACLIPCRGIEAFSSDHVWNEFWDEQWWQWEPVNTSYKNFPCYSKGWGKKFGSVIARSSTGPYIPVTDSYCENTSKIIMHAIDANNKPIDGALIVLAVMGTLDETSIFIDSYGITDNEGKFVFTVDAGRSYYARMDCALGSDPTQSNNVYRLIDGAAAGQTYQFQLKAAGTMPKANYTIIPEPGDTLDDFMLNVTYSLKDSYTNWGIRYDDLSGGATYFHGTASKPNIYICDEDNYLLLASNKVSNGYSVSNANADDSFSFAVPSDDRNWYCVFNGDNNLNNYSYLTASAALYISPAVSVENNSDEESFSVYPNPAQSKILIDIELDNTSSCSLEVYNTSGLFVTSIFSGSLDKGRHIFNWNGLDRNYLKAAPGLYFVRLSSGTSVKQQKVVLAD